MEKPRRETGAPERPPEDSTDMTLALFYATDLDAHLDEAKRMVSIMTNPGAKEFLQAEIAKYEEKK